MLMISNDTGVIDSFPTLRFRAYIAVEKAGAVGLSYAIVTLQIVWIKYAYLLKRNKTNKWLIFIRQRELHPLAHDGDARF